MNESLLEQGNILSYIEYLTQPPSSMEFLFAILVAVLCMGAVGLSSLLKPVRREETLLYWIFGAVLELLHALLPLLISGFAFPSAPLMLLIYNLRPLVRLFLLSLGEFLFLMKRVEKKRRLIGALALQAFFTLLIEWIGSQLLLMFIF